ncbi:MAG: polysaccharide deacetylase family protein [Gammaproteobacteria bacterium]
MKNNQPILALKIDVDTERGTRIGVPQLASLLKGLSIPATFFFSLGPDNTGRALKRIFRPGFLSKVKRTSVVSTYGIRTLLNGILLPGPHIGHKHTSVMRKIQADGFELGIHCYDHVRWQDGVSTMSRGKIALEFAKAQKEFTRIFGISPEAAAAPGWQANEKTLATYDAANLIYASDTRGQRPFFPRSNDQVFRTLQIPTTLPTLDEILGLPSLHLNALSAYYFSLLQTKFPNVLTIHAELEGMKYLDWFTAFLKYMQKQGVIFTTLSNIAAENLKDRTSVPVLDLIQGEVPGRSGKLAIART